MLNRPVQLVSATRAAVKLVFLENDWREPKGSLAINTIGI
jgi:hypothetical protein